MKTSGPDAIRTGDVHRKTKETDVRVKLNLDGAGKSTVTAELVRWLSKDFAVSTVHLGKPPWSLLSSTAQRVWLLAGLSRRSPRGRRAQTTLDRRRQTCGPPSIRAYIPITG